MEMEALKVSFFSSFHYTMISTTPRTTQFEKTLCKFPPRTYQPNSFISSIRCNKARIKLFTAISASSTETTYLPHQKSETEKQEEKFDWYSHWYPIMPLCDLDKSKPHGKMVLGLDVVAWWDRNDNEWKVFDDACPHRLAPLSEGRIDQWGRLQCVYHGWCFGGSGDCKLIPQAPQDGPPVHTFKKACVAVYPSTVQNGILWFWPNTDPQYKNILIEKKPPYVPELDDPSYTKSMIYRDLHYGYEVLTENLMDPSHVPYAHYKLMRVPQPKVKADREGGRPLDLNVQKVDISGFTSKQPLGENKFIPPCLYYGFINLGGNPAKLSSSPSEMEGPSRQKRVLLVFYCIPVSPSNSRLIFVSPRNFGVWIDRIVPRWIFHLGQNLILDSDLYLLHVEERKILNIGPSNWQKACFVPTKADALVVAFRRWIKKYAGGQIDWGTKFGGALPPTPPKEQLMDRYWTHVVNCSSCSLAYTVLNALEITMQVISVAAIGIVAATKPGVMSAASRSILVFMAVLSFLASRWLSKFIYKNFHFHDYNHAQI